MRSAGAGLLIRLSCWKLHNNNEIEVLAIKVQHLGVCIPGVGLLAQYLVRVQQLELRGDHSYNIMTLFVELEFATMAGKQTKILSDKHLRYLLTYVGATRYPDRNRIIILLSVKAGLRAGEIAGLTWEMVLGPSGEVGTTIELHDKAAKKSSGRRVPVHPALRAALVAWKQQTAGKDRS
jgi:integrase